MLMWLLATEAQEDALSPSLDILQQFGLPTFVAVVFGAVAWKLFTEARSSHAAEIERIQATHQSAIERADAAYDKEVTRGDRLESELRELNRLINDKLAGELVKATDAIREALEMTRDRRRQ